MTAAHGSSEPSATEDGEIESASSTTRPALSPSSSSLITPVSGLEEPNDVRAIAIVRCVSCGLSYATVIVRICRACERGEHPA